MAERRHTLEIHHGAQRQDKFHEQIDPDDWEAVQEILHDWLTRERWDRSLWHDFTITVTSSPRLVEVRG